MAGQIKTQLVYDYHAGTAEQALAVVRSMCGGAASTAPGTVHPLMAREAAEHALFVGTVVVDASQSAVIPVCIDDDDLVFGADLITVTVDAAELMALRYGDTPARVLAALGTDAFSARLEEMPEPLPGVAVAVDGALVTRYIVVLPNGVTRPELHLSAEAAGDAAIDLMAAGPNLLRAVVHENGDADLMVVERPEPVSAEVTFRTQTVNAGPSAVRGGWLVGVFVED